MRTVAAVCHTLLAAGMLAYAACDLNPQPLPPGETPEGGGGSGQQTAAPNVGGGADAAGVSASRLDAMAGSDSPLDGGAVEGDAAAESLLDGQIADGSLEGSSEAGESDAKDQE
jgi:hypothetical protein